MAVDMKLMLLMAVALASFSKVKSKLQKYYSVSATELNPLTVSNIFNDYVIFKILGSYYAACCVGEWDSKCWNDRGDYNFNHACYDCTNSPCANQCEYINGSYDSNAASSEACETCCRTVTHDVDWKCSEGKVQSD